MDYLKRWRDVIALLSARPDSVLTVWSDNGGGASIHLKVAVDAYIDGWTPKTVGGMYWKDHVANVNAASAAAVIARGAVAEVRTQEYDGKVRLRVYGIAR